VKSNCPVYPHLRKSLSGRLLYRCSSRTVAVDTGQSSLFRLVKDPTQCLSAHCYRAVLRNTQGSVMPSGRQQPFPSGLENLAKMPFSTILGGAQFCLFNSNSYVYMLFEGRLG